MAAPRGCNLDPSSYVEGKVADAQTDLLMYIHVVICINHTR